MIDESSTPRTQCPSTIVSIKTDVNHYHYLGVCDIGKLCLTMGIAAAVQCHDGLRTPQQEQA